MLKYQIDGSVSGKAIADLRESVGWNRLEEEFSHPLLRDYFSISCWDDENLVGYLSVVSNGVTDAYIQDVMVAPAFQKKGIGTRLMEHALNKLKTEGIYMVSLIYGDESLRAYYEKFGFSTMLSGQLELKEI
ncbi:GNAT family N-acetyltransferase [Enterococcus saccharolyticus]|uniref:GNAT family N-acetyltransferase n=1 Tax=Enterococcus saccharolyticus TaxID=41997 RepID=UPI001E38AC19|nr:GNAT family N-acetyltransferase [Enterococcus saccharolyticus]MCD5002316.1 GNAT family N-acetyltransferase [Enterococcus saccharolyticus]